METHKWEDLDHKASPEALDRARRELDEELDAYEPDDPKHPTFHERASDLWDMRDGK